MPGEGAPNDVGVSSRYKVCVYRLIERIID